MSEMPRPGLQTRDKNRTTRPGVDAGVEKKYRRTQAQMKQVRADEAAAEAQAALDRDQAKKRLAAVEDKQHEEDVAYAKHANHPPARPPKNGATASKAANESAGSNKKTGVPTSKTVNDTSSSASKTSKERLDYPPNSSKKKGVSASDAVDNAIERGSKKSKGLADISDSEESEAYAPASGEESSDEDKSDTEVIDSDEDEPPKKKKKKLLGITRTEVIASRTTRDESGTPEVPVDDSKKRKAAKGKTKKNAKKPKVEGKKSGLIKGAPQSLITIQPVPPRAPTRKELRGGSNKWHLKHLPTGTQAQFTDEVVPLACELAGSQQVPPWGKLSVAQVQGIVDKVYGANVHEVTAESAWMGLIGYRLNDWRHGIGARPHKFITSLVEAPAPSSDSEDDAEEEAGGELLADQRDEDMELKDVDDAANDTAAANAPLNTGPQPRKFRFDTPAGVAEFIAWCLESDTKTGSSAFHWKVWGDGVKKGFFQSPILLYTLAYHLERLDEIPGGYERLESHPQSALLMSAQAVERELQFWRSGEYLQPGTRDSSAFFSIDNWDDIIEMVKTPQGMKKKHTRRATKFSSTLGDWDNTRWDAVIEASRVYKEVPARKRGQTITSSRSSSEVGDDMICDDAVIVLSD
ncbi:hypothetical protein MSAN_02486900 [Mycena sanguinolenta]|uniref:Uncharacterized protein n=1 Tax=Mycena sanguinolenta TaxID=230812 RepID=A0A8H6WUD6_9AGAR|nr:hypothetical protein MSAN_02486900 [Mycena sanguinolenta]